MMSNSNQIKRDLLKYGMVLFLFCFGTIFGFNNKNDLFAETYQLEYRQEHGDCCPAGYYDAQGVRYDLHVDNGKNVAMVAGKQHAPHGVAEWNVVIPDKVSHTENGVTIESVVLGMAESAFDSDYCEELITKLNSVEIKAKQFTKIGKWGFYKCRNLKMVTLSESLTEIGDRAFVCCSSLNDIRVSDGNSKYMVVDGVLYQITDTVKKTVSLILYPREDGIGEQLTLPGEITYKGVKYVVTGIGDMAFCCCKKLGIVIIPECLVTVGEGVFADCVNLREIRVAEENSKFISFNNVLYEITSANTVSLVSFPAGHRTGGNLTQEFEVPEEIGYDGVKYKVTEIGNRAFYGCESLKKIVVSKFVTVVYKSAFEGCINLSEIEVAEGNNKYIVVDNVLYEMMSANTVSLILFPIGHKTGGEATKKFEVPEEISHNGVKYVVTTIGEWAFEDCVHLEEVDLSNHSKLVYVGNGAFYGCEELKSLKVSEYFDNVVIGKDVFTCCPKLTFLGSRLKGYMVNFDSKGEQVADGVRVETQTNISEEITKAVVTIEGTGYKPKTDTVVNLLLFGKYDIGRIGKTVKITYYYYDEKMREYKQLGEEVTVSPDANLIIRNIYDGLRIVLESA